MITGNKLLTIREAAGLLKVHWQTVRNYINTGRLKSVRIGRSIRILSGDLENLVYKKESDSKKYEVELRFIAATRTKIEGNLIKLGARVVYQGRVIDHWYVPKNIKNLAEKDAFYESGKGYGIRIREQDNGYTGKITTTLEVKSLVYPHKHDTCLEHEMSVSSYYEADGMLAQINHKEMAVLDKDRLVYRKGEYKVEIDDIKNFKTGISVELVTAGDREKTLSKLKKFAEKIGLDTDKELIEKSVTHLYLQKFAKF